MSGSLCEEGDTITDGEELMNERLWDVAAHRSKAAKSKESGKGWADIRGSFYVNALKKLELHFSIP
ncbi:MAG TPA: hypothetical protein VGN88_13175 [Phycisphaerae bacterium]|jgi:hypothetical protein